MPTAGLLRVEVIPESDRYRLTSEDYAFARRHALWAASAKARHAVLDEAAKPAESAPPPFRPSVLPLRIRLTNVSDQPLHIADPSDCYSLKIDIDGPGVIDVHDFIQNMAVEALLIPPRRGERHSLAPGESFDISLTKLYRLDRASLSQWWVNLTEPGKIAIRASYEARCDDERLSFVKGASEPAFVYVVADRSAADNTK